MKRERIELILGTAVLALGIIILMFVLSLALPIVQSPGEFIEEQVPEDEDDVEPPRADFHWSAKDLTVDFNDDSKEGDNPITSWYWSFGDGQTSNERNPTHTYSSDDDYFVTLEVSDGQGNFDTAETNIYVRQGDGSGGSAEEDSGDISFEMGNFLMPLAVTLLTFFMFFILFLVGAAITKAGWNLIKPKPRYVKIKIKPKDLEVEPLEDYGPRGGYGAAPYPAQPGAYATPAHQESEPPPPGVEPMCPNCGADIESGWKTCPTCGASL